MYNVGNRSEDNMCSSHVHAVLLYQTDKKKRPREADEERGNRVDKMSTVFLM